MDSPDPYASAEEHGYATILELGARLGLLLLVIGFLLYVCGAVPTLVPLDQLPRYWGLSAQAYAAATHTPTGWSWVRFIGRGENLSLAAIAFLAAASVWCSLRVIPLFARRGETVHVLLAVLQIVVLLLAASNVLVAAR